MKDNNLKLNENEVKIMRGLFDLADESNDIEFSIEPNGLPNGKLIKAKGFVKGNGKLQIVDIKVTVCDAVYPIPTEERSYD